MEPLANGLKWIGSQIISLLFFLIGIIRDYYTLPGDLLLNIAGLEDHSSPESLIVSVLLSSLTWWLLFVLIKNRFTEPKVPSGRRRL